MKKIILSLLPLLLFLSLMVFPGMVFAKGISGQSLGMIISPPVFSNITANPGGIVSNVIKVYNTSPNPLNITMQVDNYSAIGDNGAVQLQNSNQNSQYSLASWISVSPRNLYILPNSYKYVNFTINIPINAQPGSRFASIVAFASGRNTVTGSQVGTKIGSLILLTIAGNAKVDAILNRFSVSNFISNNGVLTFTQLIKDTGNVTLRPTGSVVITNMFGQKVTTIPLQQRDIIPNAVRKTEETLNTNGYFGVYTASLFVNYNSEGKGGNLFKSITFYVIPINEIIIIILIILVLFIFRKNIFRAYRAFFSKN